MRRDTVLKQLPIRSSDFVVEIGAGPTPYWHTKLILDKYPFDNTERHGDIENVAPVVKADAIKLPLADKAWDVVFMSHVIEHLPDPGSFIKEAKRCSEYIYLEFPSLHRELMYAWSFHPWLVVARESKLIFYKNDIPQMFAGFFHDHYDFLFDVWSEQRFRELNTDLFVRTEDLDCEIAEKSALEYVLETSAGGEDKINYRSYYGKTGLGKVEYPLSLRLKTIIWAMTPNRLVRARKNVGVKINQANQKPLTGEILDRMACVKCRCQDLQLEAHGSEAFISCQACGEKYGKVNGIFDFDV